MTPSSQTSDAFIRHSSDVKKVGNKPTVVNKTYSLYITVQSQYNQVSTYPIALWSGAGKDTHWVSGLGQNCFLSCIWFACKKPNFVGQVGQVSSTDYVSSRANKIQTVCINVGMYYEARVWIQSSDNDSAGFWPPGSLHTLGADGHIWQRDRLLCGLKFFALNIFCGNTYYRVYIWCCWYGENRYCERYANK